MSVSLVVAHRPVMPPTALGNISNLISKFAFSKFSPLCCPTLPLNTPLSGDPFTTMGERPAPTGRAPGPTFAAHFDITNIRRAANVHANKVTHEHMLVSNNFKVTLPSHQGDHSKFVAAIQANLLSHLTPAEATSLNITAMYHSHGDGKYSVVFSFTSQQAAMALKANIRPFSYSGQGIYFQYQTNTLDSKPPVVQDYSLRMRMRHGYAASSDLVTMVRYTLETEHGVQVHSIWQPRLNGRGLLPWLTIKCLGTPNVAKPVHHITWEGLGDWGYLTQYDLSSRREHPELRSNPLPVHPSKGTWCTRLPSEPAAPNTTSAPTDATAGSDAPAAPARPATPASTQLPTPAPVPSSSTPVPQAPADNATPATPAPCTTPAPEPSTTAAPPQPSGAKPSATSAVAATPPTPRSKAPSATATPVATRRPSRTAPTTPVPTRRHTGHASKRAASSDTESDPLTTAIKRPTAMADSVPNLPPSIPPILTPPPYPTDRRKSTGSFSSMSEDEFATPGPLEDEFATPAPPASAD